MPTMRDHMEGDLLMPFTPTDEGDLVDIPRRQVDFFLDWCIDNNRDPSTNEARQAYFDEVAAWNQEHELTGTCANPECQQGIRENREVCSYVCHLALNKEN